LVQKGEVSTCLIKQHTIKQLDGVQVQLQASPTSETGGNGQLHFPNFLTPQKNSTVDRTLDRLQNWCLDALKMKISCP